MSEFASLWLNLANIELSESWARPSLCVLQIAAIASVLAKANKFTEQAPTFRVDIGNG